MSNTHKTIIAIISLVVLATGTGIYLNTQPKNVNIQSNITTTSSKQFVSSKNSQVKSVTSSSQAIKTAISQAVSEVKVAPVQVVQTGESTENIDGVQVTYLDSKNPPQYIKDYFNCSSKQSDGSNIFIKEGENINFFCPPNTKCETPKQGLQFNYDSKKWFCNYGQDGIRGCTFGIDTSSIDGLIKSQLLSKINFEERISELESCFLFINSELSGKEITLINKIFPNKKLIIYKQY